MNEFYSIVLVPVLGTIITAVVSYLGIKIKALIEKWAEDKTKRDAAETCVRAVEQLYKDLHGEEKFKVCVENLTAMLNEKGITITELEIKMLVEAAVQKLNEAVKLLDVPISKSGEELTECTSCDITYFDGGAV